MKNNVKIISELASTNELLQVVNTLHEISPVHLITVTPAQGSDIHQAEICVTADETTIIIQCKSISIARMMARTIQADTGAKLEIMV